MYVAEYNLNAVAHKGTHLLFTPKMISWFSWGLLFCSKDAFQEMFHIGEEEKIFVFLNIL